MQYAFLILSLLISTSFTMKDDPIHLPKKIIKIAEPATCFELWQITLQELFQRYKTAEIAEETMVECIQTLYTDGCFAWHHAKTQREKPIDCLALVDIDKGKNGFLHLAIKRGNYPLINVLCQLSDIFLSKENKEKQSPMLFALSCLKKLEVYEKKHIDSITQKKTNLLVLNYIKSIIELDNAYHKSIKNKDLFTSTMIEDSMITLSQDSQDDCVPDSFEEASTE